MQRRIVERRQKWNGPKGFLFCSGQGWNEAQLGLPMNGIELWEHLHIVGFDGLGEVRLAGELVLRPAVAPPNQEARLHPLKVGWALHRNDRRYPRGGPTLP